MCDFKGKYYTEQIITYIGNKRSLLEEINEMIKIVLKELDKDKLKTADLFAGSGVVARLLKKYSSLVVVNDIEKYSQVINQCFLSNKDEIDIEIFNHYLEKINQCIDDNPIQGIVSKNYAPKNDHNIKINERVFYTSENAIYIDSFRHYIDKIVPENYKKFFLALLITEASIHVNTSGVFKGFYKDRETKIGKFGGSDENALSRITSKISISAPVVSDFSSNYLVFGKDAVELVKALPEIDLIYLDPPYNQHPYGSNYFMLNLILDNQLRGETSKVSGIPKNWNRSPFNKREKSLNAMEKIVANAQCSYIIISYNNEGFITFDQMVQMLSKYGEVRSKQIRYNTFRGSRNLGKREKYTSEFIFLLRKVNRDGIR